jgi:hypothetical protein
LGSNPNGATKKKDMNRQLFNTLEALCMMWEQYCDGQFGHECMSAGESTMKVLKYHRLLKNVDGPKSEIDWDRLELYRKWVEGGKRFSYSTVGYGVFSLLGEKYRMGRIEVFDREDESGYQVHEGIYTMPFEAAHSFEEWIEDLETDLPINIEIGSHEWCANECAKALGFEDDEDMRNPEKIEEYRKKKNDKYAKEQGYEDWNDLLAKSKWTKKQ